MVRISYHASHEQFSPRELLDLVSLAEFAGFDAAFASDHLQPWAPEQAHSGSTWSWLGAALQATKHLTFGTITVPGGWRYHPVILAQAIATLGEMFPDRLPWVAFGSGEAVNECVVGEPWPDKQERNERLKEGAEVIRALLAGETVTHRGRVTAIEAKIWSRPKKPTRLIGAATSPKTAKWLGSWADGLLTVGRDVQTLREIIDAFRSNGGEGKPVYLKADLSWARTEEDALRQAHEQWRFNVLGGDAIWDLRRPEDIANASRFVKPDDMRASVLVSADLNRHIAWLQERVQLGVESIDLHNVGRNQREFIEAFGEKVLPALR
jgi:coenzyme F420-dependent glucose-6-phosphate dehydrogenase